MVSSIVGFSKYLSDEPIVSRGVLVQDFAIGIDCEKGGQFGKYDQKLHESYKSSIFWKNH